MEQNMTMTAGIRSFSSLNFNAIGEIKQTLLLFDTVGVPQLDTPLNLIKEKHRPGCIHRQFVDQLEYLKEQKLLFNSMTGKGVTLKKGVDAKVISDEFNALRDIITNNPDFSTGMDAAVRLSCLLLNNDDKYTDLVAVPLVQNLSLTGEKKATKTDVINIIIEKMPIPDDKTPWENILEFKSNKDNIGRFAGLRTWINKAVRSGNSVNEIKDELEYLLHQYEKNLNLHNIKFNRGIIQSLVIGSAELLENAAKLKFSEIAKGFFSASQSHADLLKAEFTAPGHDIAYIYQANKQFPADKDTCE